MKLTKLWASALGLLALASCSKDAEPNQPVEQPTTKVVHINLTAGQDDTGLRATYGVKTDESGALTGLQMSDKDVFLRVAVRQGTGDPVVQDIKFTKTAGRNHATYSGPITIPISGTGSYTIAALLMKEDGADGEVFLTEQDGTHPTIKDLFIPYSLTPALPSTDNKLKLNVPYLTDWQPITVGTDAVNPTTLYLKPFGTILRMRIKNESASSMKFHRVVFHTEAFTGGHNVQGGGTFRLYAERDNKPYYSPRNSGNLTYVFANDGIEVPASQYSPWTYIWVVPRTNPTSLSTTAFLTLSAGNIATAEPYRAFYTTQFLPVGSVPMTLVYKADGHQAEIGELPEYDGEWGGTTTPFDAPLSLLSEHPLKQDKTGFVSDFAMANAEVGYFSYDDVTDFFTPQSFAGGTYSVPTSSEMAAIFPPFTNSFGRTVTSLPAGNYLWDVVENNITIDGITQSFKADYFRKSNLALYGIRLKSTSNRYRTAYRYTTYDEGGEKGILVESTPIGRENIELSTIQEDSFWSSTSRVITKRRFPAYGINYSASGVTTGTVHIGTATAVDAASVYRVYSPANNAIPEVALFSRKDDKTPYYLFKRN